MSRKKGEGQTPFLLAAAPLGDGTPHPGRSDFRPENLRNAGPEEKVPREVCPSPTLAAREERRPNMPREKRGFGWRKWTR